MPRSRGAEMMRTTPPSSCRRQRTTRAASAGLLAVAFALLSQPAGADEGGVSFANILSDLEMREGLSRGTTDLNYTNKVQQIANENAATEAKTKGAINSTINQAVASTPVPTGNPFLGAAADIAGAGLKIADKTGLFDDIFRKKLSLTGSAGSASAP